MKIHRASPLFLVLCHTSCSDDNHDAAPAPLPSVEITTENAVELARTTLHAVFSVADVGNVGGKVVAEKPPPMMVAGVGVASFLENRLAELAAGSIALPLLITVNLPGAGGGHAVRTLDDRDDDGSASTGDEIAITFVDYVDGLLTLNGSMVLDDIVVQGDLLEGFSWILSARMQFAGLEVTNGTLVEALTGNVQCTLEQRSTVTVLTMQVDSPLTLGGSTLMPGNAIAVNRYSLDFKLARFGAGALMDEDTDGLLCYEITVPFTGPNGYPYSEAGEMEILGQFGSCITIKVLDLMNVEVTVDVDGDGEVDGMTMLEWPELLNPE